METTKFRISFSNTRYGYIDIDVPNDKPGLASTLADNIRRCGEFPKDLDNIKDNGWVLEDISKVEE